MDDTEIDGPYNGKSKVCQESCSQDQTEEDEPYCFSNRRRGVAVLILYSRDYTGLERSGWENDRTNLEYIFSYLGFEVRIYEDLCEQDLITNLKKVSEEDHSDCDCFVLAVSAHGHECHVSRVREDTILTTDLPIKTREIVDMFTNESCPSLEGKPRLIFIQACRGVNYDDGQEISLQKSSGNVDMLDAAPPDMTDVSPMGLINRSSKQNVQQNIAIPNLDYRLRQLNITRQGRQVLQETAFKEPVVSPAPCHKDFLVMYATPPGYYAFRRQTEGSWFVSSLTEVLLQTDGTRSLIKELTRVIRLVAENYSSKLQKLNDKKQTPVIYSMLCKDIYMAPKSPVQVGKQGHAVLCTVRRP